MSMHGLENQDFFSWWRRQESFLQSRPWLILGKGPSFSKLGSIDKDQYFLLGLNHVIRQTKVTIAHAIDLDVIESCQDIVEDQAQYVVLPWHPHVNNRASPEPLPVHVERLPVLARLAAAGRLFWYNASTAPAPHGDSPVMPVKYFSAEAGINLLATAGVRKLRTLGIDGGASYSNEFAGIGTLLANGRRSFNKQFEQIAKAIMKHDLDYAPLGADAPIKVFVATTEAQMLAVKVLEYSIRKHASMSVEVTPLHTCGIDIPMPREEKNWPRTPFSFQRLVIPQACAYKGRAIYLDSDMQVFSDIREVWEMDMQGNQLLSAQDAKEGGRKPQYSVMLLDCAALRDWHVERIVGALDAGTLSYEDLMYRMSVARQQAALIPADWNSLEAYKEGKTRLLHYTDMQTQPWIYSRHLLGHVWCADLFEAIRNGCIDKALVDDHIARGWVRPSLGYQLEHMIVDPLLLPRHARDMDKGYEPPFLGIHKHAATPWTSLGVALLAALRHIYMLSPLPGLQRLYKAVRARYE